MFGMKKKNRDEGSAAAPEENVKVKKRAKKSALSLVLNESVAETVEDIMKNNETFIRHVPKTGEELYTGLLFNVDDIGGLDKKSRKDEQKGALIEAFNSGSLQCAVNQDLMDDNKIIIIPDANTLSNLMDHSILDRGVDGEPIQYTLVSVEFDGDGFTYKLLQPETKITIDQLISVIGDKEGTVDDFFDDPVEESAQLFDDDSDKTESSGEPVDDDDDGTEDIDDIDDLDGLVDAETGEPAAQTTPVQTVSQSVPQEQTASQYDNQASQPVQDPNLLTEEAYQQAQQEEAAPEQEDEVPDEWVDHQVTRKFYSDELGLEVTTEPFDAQFLQNNDAVLFSEDRPSSWMNDQLNEMSRAANTELRRIHMNHLFNLRERYFFLISKACDRIQSDLDIQNSDTQYGQIFSKLQETRANEMSGIESRISRKKDDLEGAWRRKLQEVGQDAARAAQQQYRARYGKDHDADMFHIENDVQSEIEDEYQDSCHEMNDRRRMEASKLLDMSITETLNELSDQYVAYLEEEQTRYNEFEENMKAFIDDNRQNDIARTNVLQEQLAQSQKADKVMAEQTERFRNASAKWAHERDEQRAEMDKLRADNKMKIDALTREHEKQIQDMQKKQDQLTSQIDRLNHEKADMYETVGKEYQGRLNEKKMENKALHDRLDDAHYMQHRSNVITGYLVIAAILAALAIGFVGGSYVHFSSETKQQEQQMIQEYNERHAVDDSSSENSSKEDTKLTPKASEKADKDASASPSASSSADSDGSSVQ